MATSWQTESIPRSLSAMARRMYAADKALKFARLQDSAWGSAALGCSSQPKKRRGVELDDFSESDNGTLGTSASNDGVKFVYITHAHSQSTLTDSTTTSSNSSSYSVIDAFGDNNGHQQHGLRQSSPDPFSSNKLIQIAPNAHGKLRAIIELMALRVREKQRLLRAQVVERFFHWIEKISVVHVVQHCVMHERQSSLSASNVQIASAA